MKLGWRAALPRIAAVILFGVAMAYVESAAVVYLRTIYGGVDPVGPRHPLPAPDFGLIEIGREACTVVMLVCVGWLAGKGRDRFWAFLAAFGVWDVFYYVFLWLFTGWPASLFAPDVLFLIPLPWWGPVISPALIALLMVGLGALAMAREHGDGLPPITGSSVLLLSGGAMLCLLAFMAGPLAALPQGLDAAFDARNPPFPWGLYLPGLLLMAAGGAAGLLRGLFLHVEAVVPQG